MDAKTLLDQHKFLEDKRRAAQLAIDYLTWIIDHPGERGAGLVQLDPRALYSFVSDLAEIRDRIGSSNGRHKGKVKRCVEKCKPAPRETTGQEPRKTLPGGKVAPKRPRRRVT
jgi:hypothetical protein